MDPRVSGLGRVAEQRTRRDEDHLADQRMLYPPLLRNHTRTRCTGELYGVAGEVGALRRELHLK